MDETITAAGKAYDRVKYKSTIVPGNDVSPAITRIWIEHNIVVKQDTLDARGNAPGDGAAERA